MAGFGVKEKVIFVQTFGAWDSDRAGRAKHFATLHFLALLFPPLHKHRRWWQPLQERMNKQIDENKLLTIRRIEFRIIGTLLLLTICSPGCRNKTAVADSPHEMVETKFKKFISKFNPLTIPFTAKTDCYSPDSLLSVKLEMANDSTFLDYVGPAVTVGIFPDTSKFYALIYCAAAACYLPELAVYTKEGKTLSRQALAKGCGSDSGYICSESLTIKSLTDISVVRTETAFKVDNSDKEVPGSRKEKTELTTYSVNNKGIIEITKKSM